MSLSSCAQEYNYTRPIMTKQNVLIISHGRNPLQEITVPSFIPNSTNIQSENQSRINIIMGPNNSGKSVYMKQVGMIVLMAHVGCFVPAQDAVIGITDRIMTRISSQDSITVNQSSFALDLLQIQSMMTLYTNKTLLLIDEFGKGTLALDGLSLLSSTINYLINKAQCPKVFVSTHYTELIEYKLINANDLKVQMWSMDVVLDNDHHDHVVYLYNLVSGKVVPSYGAACASMAGIPQEIISRAKDVSLKLRHNEPVERLQSGGLKHKQELYVRVVDMYRRLVDKSCFDLRDVEDFLSDLRNLKE
ncbi:DNA mismatch repair protein [Acrasis kona]|uniref:DNA mismatch repair protein MSH5 n=1 Tax=Acrasis kona TaxID=1008807 RepID=A0AAW2ZMV5_9EUKA